MDTRIVGADLGARSPKAGQADDWVVSTSGGSHIPRLSPSPSKEGLQLKIAQTRLAKEELERRYQEELRWSQKEISHLKQELEVSRRRKADVEDELKVLKGQLEQAQEQLQASNAEVQELQSRLELRKDSGARAEAERLRSELADAYAALTAEKAARAEAQGALEGAQTAMCSLLASHEQLQQRSLQQTESLAKREEELSAARQAVEALEALVAELQAGLAQAKSSNALLTEQADEAARQAASLRDSVVQKDEEIVGLSVRLGTAQSAKQAAEVEAEAARTAAAAAQRELDRVLGTTNLSAHAVQALRDKHERIAAEFTELQGEYSKVVFEHAKARAEHAEMSGKLTKVKSELQGLRAERDAHSSQVAAECGTITKLLSVLLRQMGGSGLSGDERMIMEALMACERISTAAGGTRGGSSDGSGKE